MRQISLRPRALWMCPETVLPPADSVIYGVLCSPPSPPAPLETEIEDRERETWKRVSIDQAGGRGGREELFSGSWRNVGKLWQCLCLGSALQAQLLSVAFERRWTHLVLLLSLSLLLLYSGFWSTFGLNVLQLSIPVSVPEPESESDSNPISIRRYR